MKQRFHFFKRAMTLVIALAMLLTTFPAMAFANEVPTALEEATPANEVPVAVEEANPADDPTLELWLRMDETSGTNVHDSSGNNRHATLAGNAGTGDWIMDGDGLDLWGTASGAGTRHVVLPRIFEDIPGDFTITTEVYFRSGGAWSRIFDFGPSSTGNIMFMTANTLQVNMSNANALIPPGAVNNTNNANRWRSVTVTHIAGDPGPTGTPGTTIIYINGVEVARGTQNAPVDRAPAAGQFFIGRANWAPDPAANMQVRDFRVYSRALPATEIAEMYMDFLVEDVDIFAFFDGDTLPDNIANLPVTWTADAGIIGADGRLIGGTDIRRVTVTADFGGVVRDFPIVILPVDYWDNPDGAVVLPKSTGNNPITWPEFTADPAPVVIDDTVWLIGGRDMGGTSYNIPHYVAYSSKDLINWTYHGVVLSASDVSWLSNDSAWAAHMVPYTGTDGIRRYYLYTCGWGTGAGFSGSTHLGVAVADHPAGPYVDIGQPLMHSSVTQTPPGIPNDHGWADIDPMVFITEIDGEERRFITWGNERFRIAELNEDMISLKDRNGDGQITNADISDMLQGDSFRNAPPMPPGMFHFTEGPWLHERDGIFYVFYAGGWYEDLSYARALDIYGPWYHSSRIMEPTATSNTNHPGVIDFNGRTYLFYHNGMQPGGNGHGRSVSIVEIKFDDLGFIYPMHELSIGVGGTASTLTLANDDAIGYDWFENPRGGHPLFRDIRVDEGGEHVSEAAFRTEWEIVQGRGRDGDTFVSLQAVHKPGLLITATSSADTQLTQDIYGANFAMAQTFRTLEGATEHGVRFESYLFPGMFLTNVDGDLVLTDGLDAAASTFYVEEVNVDPHRPMPAHNGVVAYPFDSFVPDTNPADDPDLEIWLRMDETAGTVVHDSSVHGRHAALAGNDGTGYWNPEHNSLDLWGVATGAAAANQRHVVLPRIFQHIPDDFTISTDVYFRSGATWARLFDFGPGSTGNLVFMTANTLQTNMSNANALTPPASFNNTNNPSQWRTVTLTHTAGDPGPTGAPGTTVIYIDGIEVARGPQNVPINRNPATGEFFIGRANWPDPTPNMMVRDFRIYSRALSDADVFHHFRAPGTTVWDLFDVPARVPGGFELPTEVVGQPVIWVSSVPEALEDGRLIVAGTNEQEIVLTATIGGQTRTFPVTVFSIWHGLNLPHRPWNGFELPAAHAGQPLTWTAPEGVLDVDGRTIVITPSNDDREVTLTATIDGLTRDFTVTLPSIWDDLRMMRYKADGCVLPTRLAGVPVTWESSDPTVLDGNVIVGHADTREGVILTATRGNLTREYTVTVLGADVYQAMPPVGSSDRGDGTFANPFSFSDVPDMSIIRVGDAFWMASTTMHMMPGVPIKKSYDLVNWEIVSYCYLILEDVAQHRLHGNSHIYGMGTWASSLRHRNDTFYLTVFSNVPGRTYVFQNTDPENLPWERHVTDAVFHDMSVLFDDDGRNWMVWDDNPLLIIEMNEDMTGVLPGATQNVLIPNLHAPEPATGITPTTGLAEGAQLEKINGLYYLFAITWPPGQPRTIVVHRAANLEGPWEARVVGREAILHPDMVTGGSGGIAQGSIVQDTDGNWWGYAFRDSSAGGRMPWLMQVTWRDGWPYFGVDAYGEGHWGNLSRGGVKPMQGFMSRSLVTSDEFYNNAPREAHLDSALPTNVPRLFEEGEHDCNGSFLDSRWQWNHNPNNNFWSLTERPGWLRLHAMLNPGTTNRHLLNARNTLTQRTFGPYSSAITRIDVSNMQDGDEAGISLFTQRYGSIGVTMENGERTIVTRLSFTGGGGGIGGPGNIANTAVQSGPSVPLEGDVVYLKAEVDFLNANMNPVHATRPNTGRFFYSYDGLRWTQLGESLPMVYAISNHFMGYRYALFNFATESTGGFVDFDFFRIYDKMWGTDVPTILNAEMDDVLLTDVDTADVPLRLDPLPAGAYGEITASIYIPDGLEVRDVTFGDAVVGTGSFTVAGNQLKLLVSGPTVGFSPADMDVFAIITVERVEPLADNSAIIPDNINVRGGAFVAYDLRGVAANIITEDEMMSLVLETVTAAPGESVEVSISVENNVGLSTADIHIEFADDDIELVGRRRGLFAAPTFSGGPNHFPLIHLPSSITDSMNVEDNGALITLLFDVCPDATEEFVPIEFYSVVAYSVVGVTTVRLEDIILVDGRIYIEEPPAPVVESIAVTTQPTMLVYTEDETLDLDGLVVTLTYDDGSNREVAFADFAANGLTASPGAGTVLTLAHNGTPVTITHTTSATAATDNLTVTALEPEVVSIAVTTQPTRLVYTERSAVEPWRNTLDLDGLVVTLTYNDGSSRAVAFADFVANGLTTNPADGTALALTHNGTVVTITHTESGETATTAALTVTAIRWGDVNNDNAVTLGDVSMLNLYVLGFPVLDTWMYRGDVNHDGDVTLGDVSLLNLYVLGFPVRITPLEATAAAALAPLAADRAIEFTVDTVTAAHGDRVEVNIFVKNNDIGFTSTNMTIEFDDTKVRLLGYAGGDIFPVQTGLVPNRFSLRAPDPDLGTPWEEWNLTDDGLLLTLSFEVLTDVEELVPIALTVETYRFLTDLDGFGTTERVPVEEILLVGGGINVTGIPVTHGLTLNLAGGAWPTGFTPPATVVNGAPMPTIPTPVRDGFTFTGWTPVLPETVTRPVTATAQWTAIVIPEPEFDITVDDEYGELTITVDPDGDYEVTVDEDGNIVITLPDANPGNEIVVNLPDDWDYDVTEDEDGNVIVVITPPEGYEVVEGEDGTLLVRPVREFHEAYMFGVRRDGTLYFDPTDNITRAQVAAILARTMIDEFDSSVHSDYYELPEGMDSFDEFSDVAPNNWFYHYVAWAYHEGLVQGIGGDRFAPNALITREQLAAMLVRTLDVEDRETAVGPTMDFPDAGTISSWAPVYVYNAFRQGWMIGDRGGNFRPAENIMRAEVATAVNRMLGRVDHNDVRTRLGGALENEYRAATFPDVVVTNWFFASVLGAANDHYLSRDGDEISWKYIRVQ